MNTILANVRGFKSKNKNMKLGKKQFWICVLMVAIITFFVWFIFYILLSAQVEVQKEIPCPIGSKCDLITYNKSSLKKAESTTVSPNFSSNTLFKSSVKPNSKPVTTGIICDQELGVEYTIPEGWELRRKYKDLHIVSRSDTKDVQPIVTGESDLPFGIWIWKRKPPFSYGWSKNITLTSLLNGSTHVDNVGNQLSFSNVNGLTGIILSGMSIDDANGKAVILTDGVSIISFVADGSGYPILTDADDISRLMQIVSKVRFVKKCDFN